mmetsp:Transcript_18520/g.42734  ORF Transcript_18520/g.42734 Transcript_18520/m.42734 type:complete len:232 (+) Transcript_18520:114-809(+)
MIPCSRNLLVIYLAIALSFLSSPTSAAKQAGKLRGTRDPDEVSRELERTSTADPGQTNSWRIVSEESDVHFIPGVAVAPDSFGNIQEVFSIPGSQLIQNGRVHLVNQVAVEGNKIVGPVPDPVEGSFFNEQCTAMSGSETETGNINVENSICHYNFCLDQFGCLYLRSGGLLRIAPHDSDTSAIPSVRAAIVGGTLAFERAAGHAVIDVISRATDNDDGRMVLQLDLVATY